MRRQMFRIPAGPLTEFPVAINEKMNCRKISGFDSLDTVTKYRLYYIYDKPFAEWKKLPRTRPKWFDKPIEEIVNV